MGMVSKQDRYDSFLQLAVAQRADLAQPVTSGPEGVRAIQQLLEMSLQAKPVRTVSPEQIACCAVPGSYANAKAERERRDSIFKYIADFINGSTLSLAYLQPTGKGRNLSLRPFLAPAAVRTEGSPQLFAEQYRWDGYFHNRLLIKLGIYDLAIGQLENLADVYQMFGVIPNALTTKFLSHSQPPLDGISAYEIIAAGGVRGEWFDRVILTLERELWEFWWDRGSLVVNPRQNESTERFGDLLTRHTSVHFHSLLVGCEDGKDHCWTTACYGEHYLPAQLNAIIYKNLCLLGDYYSSQPDRQDRADMYQELAVRLRKQFCKLFWVADGRYRGFRNYSIKAGQEGPILYGDISSEIWPLFCGLADDEQAEITAQNLREYYFSDIGLMTTSEKLREGGVLSGAPEGFDCQWELNIWPPLMTIALSGLRNYASRGVVACEKLYVDVAHRWIEWLESEFARSGMFFEKAPPSTGAPKTDQGFYGNLCGFGWTITSYLDALEIVLGQSSEVHKSTISTAEKSEGVLA